MVQEVLEFRDKATRGHQCSSVILVVMSHSPRRPQEAHQDKVYGVDGGYVQVQEQLVSLFHRDGARWLIGKPKMFIVQACRGGIGFAVIC